MEFIINSPKYGKHVVEIDDEDAEKVFKHKWHVQYDITGRLDYVATNIYRNKKQTSLRLHKLVSAYRIVDHLDGNPLNNKKSNLRSCTHKQNCRNQGKRSNSSTGYKGVNYLKSKGHIYIVARITTDKKRLSLGIFPTLEAAAFAYNEAAKKYHGEFARLNEI